MTGTAIVPETIRALGALYYAARLEELRMFDVVDRLVERFLGGLLPIGRHSEVLQEWLATRTSPPPEERRALYAQAFSPPGGGTGGLPNTDFGDLWLRFLTAVAARDRSTAGGSNVTSPGDRPEATVAARALAVHLSSRRDPAALAGPVQRQTQKAMNVLSDREIQTAYGVRDVAGLIDSVVLAEFGGARNSVRLLTMANSGVTIFAWLAKRSADLSAGTLTGIPDLNDDRRSPDETIDPTDADLVCACEEWLAAG